MIILNESIYVGSSQGTKVMINSDAQINLMAVECKSKKPRIAPGLYSFAFAED